MQLRLKFPNINLGEQKENREKILKKKVHTNLKYKNSI